jgi:hypothetical protein
MFQGGSARYVQRTTESWAQSLGLQRRPRCDLKRVRKRCCELLADLGQSDGHFGDSVLHHRCLDAGGDMLDGGQSINSVRFSKVDSYSIDGPWEEHQFAGSEGTLEHHDRPPFHPRGAVLYKDKSSWSSSSLLLAAKRTTFCFELTSYSLFQSSFLQHPLANATRRREAEVSRK